MKERPILFSGPMVRAILEGRKTQTRRVIKPQPEKCGDNTVRFKGMTMAPSSVHYNCPYGQPGDRLWVRETWRADVEGETGAVGIQYRADNHFEDFAGDSRVVEIMRGSDNWRPSIHMPRWACRLLLDVKSVRVERLQDISNDDTAAEGVSGYTNKRRVDFIQLWDSLNEKRGYGWETNPWVWVIEFERANDGDSQ